MIMLERLDNSYSGIIDDYKMVPEAGIEPARELPPEGF